MNTESQYEKMYNDLVAGLEKMHRRNVKRTSSALKSLLIIPTFFLIMLFVTQGSKTIFLVLWIASMFVIAGILIVIEYQDYLLRQMFSQVYTDDTASGQNNEDTLPDEEVSANEALQLAERIRQSVQQRSPEFDPKPAESFVYDNSDEELPAVAVEEDTDGKAEVPANADEGSVPEINEVGECSSAASEEEEAKV